MNATPAASTILSADEARALGVEAYVYLYPLVTMELTRRQGTNVPPGARPAFGPMGAFHHFREFPPADFKAVVRPNFDTLYSSAWLDLTGEPMVIGVPDTDGGYYLLPMLDMWTDVFCAPGSRTSGTAAAEFVVAGPAWRGEVPDGTELIRAPTSYVWIIGRTQTNGPDDYGRVHAIQDGLSITPLSGQEADPGAAFRPDPTVDMETPTLEQVNALPAGEFFALASRLLLLHPPHATDWSILARIRRIGLQPGAVFDVDALDPTVRDALDGVEREGVAAIKASIPRFAAIVNGWQVITDTIGVYGNAYLKRAAIALAGLGANPPEDAVYPLNVTDADGHPLDGADDYVLHFERDELPPVDAFWSVTMYDADGFQAANPLNRFAIGDRDALTFNDDGSLDLYLQHESPGPERESNWLPAPRGPLGVTMRLYAPKPEVLERRWHAPPIRKVG